MEHISEHLKAHTANDSDFRALISEPRMGKVCDVWCWCNTVLLCFVLLDSFCIIHHYLFLIFLL